MSALWAQPPHIRTSRLAELERRGASLRRSQPLSAFFLLCASARTPYFFSAASPVAHNAAELAVTSIASASPTRRTAAT